MFLIEAFVFFKHWRLQTVAATQVLLRANATATERRSTKRLRKLYAVAMPTKIKTHLIFFLQIPVIYFIRLSLKMYLLDCKISCQFHGCFQHNYFMSAGLVFDWRVYSVVKNRKKYNNTILCPQYKLYLHKHTITKYLRKHLSLDKRDVICFEHNQL